MSVHKKIQPNLSSRLAGYREHIYIYSNVLFYYMDMFINEFYGRLYANNMQIWILGFKNVVSRVCKLYCDLVWFNEQLFWNLTPLFSRFAVSYVLGFVYMYWSYCTMLEYSFKLVLNIATFKVIFKLQSVILCENVLRQSGDL